MILDVPSPNHIPSLVSAFEGSSFYSRFLGVDHAEDHNVHSIFHLCGEGVLEDSRYKSLLAKFAPSVHVNVQYFFRAQTISRPPSARHSLSRACVRSRNFYQLRI